jgi:hypothetical protein
MHSSEYKKLFKLNLWVYGTVFALVFLLGLMVDIGNSFLPIILAYLSAGYMPFFSLNGMLAALMAPKKSQHRRHSGSSESHRPRSRSTKYEFIMFLPQLAFLGLIFLVIYLVFGHDAARSFAYCAIGLIILNLIFRIAGGDPLRKKSKGGLSEKDFYYLYNGIGTLLSLGFCFLYYYRYSA